MINKMDVLRELDQWKLYHNLNLVSFENEKEMCSYITAKLSSNIEIFFSDNKNRI